MIYVKEKSTNWWQLLPFFLSKTNGYIILNFCSVCFPGDPEENLRQGYLRSTNSKPPQTRLAELNEQKESQTVQDTTDDFLYLKSVFVTADNTKRVSCNHIFIFCFCCQKAPSDSFGHASDTVQTLILCSLFISWYHVLDKCVSITLHVTRLFANGRWHSIIENCVNRIDSNFWLHLLLKWTSLVRSSKLNSCYSLNGCVCWKSDIAFLRYGDFVVDVTLDWWKDDFEKKASKVWESRQNIDVNSNSEAPFYVQMLFIRQMLRAT